jgi:hypothetical protein
MRSRPPQTLRHSPAVTYLPHTVAGMASKAGVAVIDLPPQVGCGGAAAGLRRGCGGAAAGLRRGRGGAAAGPRRGCGGAAAGLRRGCGGEGLEGWGVRDCVRSCEAEKGDRREGRPGIDL